MRSAIARRFRLPAPLLVGLLAFALGMSEGGAAMDRNGFVPMQARRAQLSLDQAIEMVERRFKARVVRPGVEEADGRRVYVLRLLSEEGRVWTVRVDAQTGAVD
jgi:uncharacterized membrane protein YkoI